MSLRRIAVTTVCAGTLAAPAAAHADVLLASAPGARNLTTAGGAAAWAAPATGGRWRLVIRGRDGVIAAAPVATFGGAPDPSLGSSSFGASHLVAVYSRCAGRSTISGCDVFSYDLVTRTERRVALAATRTYSETAPSISNGRIAFVRRGGPRNGVYSVIPSYTPGRPSHLNRIDGHVARETATSISRVAFLYRNGKGQDDITLAQLDGGNRRLMARARPGVLFNPVITRYRVGWLERGAGGVSARMTDRVNPSTTRPNVRTGSRDLPASTNSAAADDRRIVSYLDATGWKSLAPPILP